MYNTLYRCTKSCIVSKSIFGEQYELPKNEDAIFQCFVGDDQVLLHWRHKSPFVDERTGQQQDVINIIPISMNLQTFEECWNRC